MATEVVMPQMGESVAEGTISKWLVKEGDKVEKDQPLLEISTDKVDAEIPSPADGVLLEIKHKEGDTVEVNQVIALIGEEGEEPERKEKKDEKKEEKEEAKEDKEEKEPEEEKVEEDEERVAKEKKKAKEEEDEEDEDEDLAERVRTFSSPVVRKIAKEEGVDLEEVEGTGIHGRVTKKDIEAYLEERKEAPRKPAAAAREAPAAGALLPGASPIPDFHVPPYTEGEDVEIEPMSRIRQITAAHMRYSKDMAAHVTTVFHIDMSRVAAVRARARRGFEKANGTKLTYMPFIIKAVASALKAHKKVNASIDGSNVVYKKAINIGIAVALDWGLIVPVIKNADQLSLTGITKTGNDLADRARAKKLKPEEVQGGTFTITNPGVFGSLFGTPVINQPQVAILGVGMVEKRPVVVTDDNGIDSISIKHMAYFAITYDHRLVDGADADHFMNDVKKILQEDPWKELAPYM